MTFSPTSSCCGARLEAEYFEVIEATSGREALEICASERVDVCCSTSRCRHGRLEVCRRLKGEAETLHIPVVMVTALDQVADKVHGLEAGADDFLTKPVDDIALVTRVKSLARLKMLNDEMLLRASTSRDLGVADEAALSKALTVVRGRILVVDDHPRMSHA